VLAYELLVGRLTDAEKDAYCLEGARTGPPLGLPEEGIPKTWWELRVYVEEMLASHVIEVTPAAQRVARDVLRPPFPRPLLPAVWLAGLPSVALLPEGLREAYGLRWSGGSSRVAWGLAWSSRAVHRVAPGWATRWRQSGIARPPRVASATRIGKGPSLRSG
jgi:uncharacterized protein (DUF2236 family)